MEKKARGRELAVHVKQLSLKQNCLPKRCVRLQSLHFPAGHTADPEHAPPPPAVKFGENNPVDLSSPDMKAKLGATQEPA
eukprot:1158553-Pelagomonas_calceolata.AAC.11